MMPPWWKVWLVASTIIVTTFMLLYWATVAFTSSVVQQFVPRQ